MLDYNLIILFLGIISGQLIKIPFFDGLAGVSALDLLIFLLTIIGLWKLKFRLAKPNLPFKIATVFILISLISLILTPLHLTQSQIIVSLAYTLRLTLYLLFTWIIYSKAFPKITRNIDKIFLYSGASLAFLGLLQFFFLPNLGFLSGNGWDPHYLRAVSTFLDPNFLGAFLVITLVIIAQKITQFTNKKWLIAGFVLVFGTLLLTFSRSSYLMFFISFTTLSFFKRSIKLFITTLALCAILFGGYKLYILEVSAPRNINRDASAYYRVNNWQVGLSVFQHSPILGVGFNSYRYALEQYHLVPEQATQTRGASSNDSSLLFVAATTGILGFIIYLAFLFSLFKTHFSLIINHKSLIFICGMISLLIHSLFNNSLFYPPILIWILLYGLLQQSPKF